MRNVHDVMCAWTFDIDPDKKPFTEGTIKMDRDDFQTALGMVYDTFGWDHEKGCPTAACLDQYGMADVKEELDSWVCCRRAILRRAATPPRLSPPTRTPPDAASGRSRLSGKGGRRIRRQPYASAIFNSTLVDLKEQCSQIMQGTLRELQGTTASSSSREAPWRTR